MSEVKLTDLKLSDSIGDHVSHFTEKLAEALENDRDALDECRLHFELLDTETERNTIANVQNAIKAIRERGVTDSEALLKLAAPDLEGEALERALDDVRRLRRNQFAGVGPVGSNNEPEAYVYIACGVVAAVTVTTVHSVVVEKIDDASFDPDGPPLGPDDGPIWPTNPNQPGRPPWRPGQPGWTDPIDPGLRERLVSSVEPKLRSKLAGKF